MSHLEDIAIRLQIYLERLKTSQTGEFNKSLEELMALVEEEFGTTELQGVSRTRLEKMLRSIRVTHADSLEEYVDAFFAGLRELADYTYSTEGEALIAASTLRRVSSPRFKELWREVEARPLASSGDRLLPWTNLLKTDQIVAVENLIRKAHVQGWSTPMMLQGLRGTRANRYTDGLMPRIGRGNETIIRTAIQHVAATARMVVWEDNEDIIRGYRWVSTLDTRTSSICRGLDGQEFEMGSGPVPPIHPNCRSTTVPLLDPVYDILERGGTRSSLTGQVSRSTTYYEWLKNQPFSFQESVIGYKRAKLLQDGGLSAEEFARLQLNRLFEPLTLEEMRRLKPLAFIRAGI